MASIQVLILFLLTMCAYWGVWDQGYIFLDDDTAIYDNPHVTQGLTMQGVWWALTTPYQDYWHPIPWITHMVDFDLYGPDPGGHHLTNLMIHICNVLLAFAVFSKMTGRQWSGFFVAALLSAHPMHVESVVWIFERKDVLGMFFWLTTLWYYIGYVSRPTKVGYAKILLAFAMGLAAKPSIVTLPFALLLLDFWPLCRTVPAAAGSANHHRRPMTWLSLVVEKIPFLGLTVFCSAATYLHVRSINALQTMEALPLGARMANIAVSYATFGRKLLWPSDLAVYYPLDRNIALTTVIWSACALLFISAAALRERKRMPWLMVGWLWFLGTLVPMVGFVHTGSQSMADRFAYVPYLGLYLAVVMTVAAMVRRFAIGRIPVAVASAGFVGVLLMVDRNYVPCWKNSRTLFERTISLTKSNYVMHNNLGKYLSDVENDNGAAKEQFRKALDAFPQYHLALANMGMVLVEADSIDKGLDYYRASLKYKPDNCEVYRLMGQAIDRKGDADQAIRQYRTALRCNPFSWETHFDLGLSFMQEKDFDSAQMHLLKALDLQPNRAEAHNGLGLLYCHKHDFRNAMPQFIRAMTIRPDMWQPYNNAGLLLLGRMRPRTALCCFTKAIAQRPTSEFPYANRAIAYLVLGISDSAKADLVRAHRMNPGNAAVRDLLQKVGAAGP